MVLVKIPFPDLCERDLKVWSIVTAKIINTDYRKITELLVFKRGNYRNHGHIFSKRYQGCIQIIDRPIRFKTETNAPTKAQQNRCCCVQMLGSRHCPLIRHNASDKQIWQIESNNLNYAGTIQPEFKHVIGISVRNRVLL